MKSANEKSKNTSSSKTIPTSSHIEKSVKIAINALNKASQRYLDEQKQKAELLPPEQTKHFINWIAKVGSVVTHCP